MKIDHLIIGSHNLNISKEFYIKILGFNEHDSFIDTGTGKKGFILFHNNLKILLVPFEEIRLPNPQHIAFLVDEIQFNKIYNTAINKKLKIRAEPNLNSEKFGIGLVDVNYKNFYILDPSNVNIEIMSHI